MNILRRGGAEEEPAKDEKSEEETPHRRIEVTVEREWVSMLVRKRPEENAMPSACELQGDASTGQVASSLELPLPKPNYGNPS